jgi:curved DNA-binding protein CbpA
MSKIEINFDSLNYNLYEVLNVPPDSDDVKIKKSFMKLIKTFHPDKNSKIEEDIFNHIILSNQILLNKETRRKYDDYLFTKALTFSELKDSFNKTSQNLFQNTDKETSNVKFNSKIDELNKKHGYSEESYNESILEKFNKIKNNRNNDISITKESFVNMDEFNNKFKNNKTEGKFKNQIVEYKDSPSELSTYVVGEHYTNLGDIDKLYIEDSVQSSKYSSLDRAFLLQPENIMTTNKNTADKMKEYQSQTEVYKNMKVSDFSTKKFSEL